MKQRQIASLSEYQSVGIMIVLLTVVWITLTIPVLTMAWYLQYPSYLTSYFSLHTALPDNYGSWLYKRYCVSCSDNDLCYRQILCVSCRNKKRDKLVVMYLVRLMHFDLVMMKRLK